MLFVAGSLSAASCLHVVAAQKVEQGSMLQSYGFVGFALIVDKKRKVDLGLLAEKAGVARVAQSDRGQPRALLLELRLKFAQLRDMLTAEDSAVVAQKDQHRRAALPQRSQARGLAIRIGKRDSCQLAAECFGHGGHSRGWRGRLSSGRRSLY
jgi:hypothetical protein